MEHIREAIERAKGDRNSAGRVPTPTDVPLSEPQLKQGVANANAVPPSAVEVVRLNAELLENNRLISHEVADPRSKSVAMLRTQVLQTMDLNSWQFLGVTSPTAGCGKSVIAINLALSIARQPERSVLLVDMDFQKPHVARYLGLKSDLGILSVLGGRAKLSNVIKKAQILTHQLFVLPCETSTLRSSELISSSAMNRLLEQIKQEFKSCTVIFDLPPMLASDDVLSILPSIDGILLVAAAGASTTTEIKDCRKYLDTVPIVRFVLNKVTDKAAAYYARYPEYA
jgi:protein-tyrosine kinase